MISHDSTRPQDLDSSRSSRTSPITSLNWETAIDILIDMQFRRHTVRRGTAVTNSTAVSGRNWPPYSDGWPNVAWAFQLSGGCGTAIGEWWGKGGDQSWRLIASSNWCIWASVSGLGWSMLEMHPNEFSVRDDRSGGRLPLSYHDRVHTPYGGSQAMDGYFWVVHLFPPPLWCVEIEIISPELSCRMLNPSQKY